MFGINKNGTKHKIGIIMPASYPSARVTFDPTVKNILPNTATDCQKAIDAVSELTKSKNILSSSVTVTANGSNTSIPLSENLDTNYMYVVKYNDIQGYGNSFIFVPNSTTTKVLIQTLYTHTTSSKFQLLIMNKTWAMWVFDGSTCSNSITITSVIKVHY